MLSRPAHMNVYLDSKRLMDDYYEALCKGDTAKVVSIARNNMLKTDMMLCPKKEVKSEEMSTKFRTSGNKAFKNGTYQRALAFYNKALMYAPKGSRAMKLAYSNRSALLFKLKCFGACLNDIDTCFEMGCPDDILEKLNKRRNDATNVEWLESMQESVNHTDFAEAFFEFNAKRNPQITSAGADIGVIVEDNIPKIVALNDIKVGAVVALETAFVSETDTENIAVACHYCHKREMNLMPCDGCCLVLFCSLYCKNSCSKDYHNTECKIVEVTQEVSQVGAITKLPLKAAIKLRNTFKTWSDFDSASNIVGINRIKQSSVKEIYDERNEYSVLNFKDDRHFYYGAQYNASFSIATLIYHLERIGYFPIEKCERKIAVDAMARVMMYLAVFPTFVKMVSTKTVLSDYRTEFNDCNFGLFSLIGKLDHSCKPNVITAALGNNMALVAVEPIKKRTELKYSFVGHWVNRKFTSCETKNMYRICGKVCHCFLCNGVPRPNPSYQLTDTQRQCLRKLNLSSMERSFCPRSIPDYFPKLCRCLAYLSDVQYSKEYKAVYKMFHRCLISLQDMNTPNIALD